jgi:hypothetical protein
MTPRQRWYGAVTDWRRAVDPRVPKKLVSRRYAIVGPMEAYSSLTAWTSPTSSTA